MCDGTKPFSPCVALLYGGEIDPPSDHRNKPPFVSGWGLSGLAHLNRKIAFKIAGAAGSDLIGMLAQPAVC
ncbi:MAG: hypothetical protein Alpg2KO_15930 [Alphaproteobacteria bacterium]